MVVIIILAVILFLTIIIGLHEKNTNAMCKSKKRLDGKVVLITGGTAGMGLEQALDLAKRGARVIIACPFEDEGVNARKHIIESTGNEKIVFKLLDLVSLKSVRDLAADILNTENRLDVLINNAGVGLPVNAKAVNGTNFIMQVNYFGHFLLTILLLPLLKKTGKPSEPSRIVNTASVLHLLGRVSHKSENREDLWYRFSCYCNSKYCCMLIAHALSKRLEGSNVVINAVDPGAVGIGIFESINKHFGLLLRVFFSYIFKTPLQGAQTALHVALDEEAGEVTGQFFKNCKLARAKSSAYNNKFAKTLWEDSIRIVKLEEAELEKCLDW